MLIAHPVRNLGGQDALQKNVKINDKGLCITSNVMTAHSRTRGAENETHHEPVAERHCSDHPQRKAANK